MSTSKRPALGFIFVTLLIDVTGFGIVIPVMPGLIEKLGHVNASQAASIGGWLLFTYATVQFLFAPVLGGLSDRFGRRPILLGSLFGFGIDYLLTGFAPNLAWLFVGRFVAGIMGSSFTTGAAYIADISTPEKRAQNFGMIGAAFGLGFILGPVIGGVLGKFGPQIPFFAAAALALLNWLYGYFVLPESLSPENRRPFDWKRANPIGSLLRLKRYPVILGMVASLVLLYIAAHAVHSTWSFYTRYRYGWDEAMIGYSLGVVGVLSALVQGLLIRVLIPKIGQNRGVYVGLAFYCVGLALFGLASQGWMMFPVLVVYCLGGIAGPSLQGIISTQVPSNEQGELQGALTSLMSVTSIIGPVFMTNIFSYFTSPGAPVQIPGIPMYAGAALAFISTLLAFAALRTKKFVTY
ncbi:MAG: TCR/Tet family MFS transporter [Chitinophagales bacterium]|nr:TCR/Tet family MFS transporter [Chitinophagales bacterium]